MHKELLQSILPEHINRRQIMRTHSGTTNKERITIWLIDDSPEYVETFSYLIEHVSRFEIKRVFPRLEECLDYLEMPFATIPDIVLLDHWLQGGINGIDGLVKLKSALPNTPVLMLTNHEDSELVAQAITKGASGYLTKDQLLDETTEAIFQALRGAFYMPPTVAQQLLGLFKEDKKNQDKFGLTDREIEVLQALAEGLKQKEIAEELSIAPKTVENHLRNIYGKLHVNSGIEAVVKALRGGIIK